MDEWSEDASEQMKIKIDTQVLQTIPSDAHANNKGTSAGRKSSSFNLGATGSPVALDKTNVLDYIVDTGTVLDEQSLPQTGRWMVIPAWMSGMIKKSDLKDASLAGDGTSILRNGRLGMIDRYTLYMSNLVYSVSDTYTCYHILFGTRHALSFAAQMTEMESLRAESTFGTLVRGLNVYGFKVLKAEALGDLYAYKG